MHTAPQFIACFWGMFFANMGGGGVVNLFCESADPLQGSKSPKSGKEVPGSKTSHFRSPGRMQRKGILDSNHPLLGRSEMGVF